MTGGSVTQHGLQGNPCADAYNLRNSNQGGTGYDATAVLSKEAGEEIRVKNSIKPGLVVTEVYNDAAFA